MARPEVSPEVIAVVREWALAPDLSGAATVLSRARRTLDGGLCLELRGEVAEIAAETLVELLFAQSTADEETVDVDGLALTARQLERVAAWAADQKPTAEALGVAFETWTDEVLVGLAAVLRAHGKRGPASPTVRARRSTAEKLLGGGLAPRLHTVLNLVTPRSSDSTEDD